MSIFIDLFALLCESVGKRSRRNEEHNREEQSENYQRQERAEPQTVGPESQGRKGRNSPRGRWG